MGLDGVILGLAASPGQCPTVPVYIPEHWCISYVHTSVSLQFPPLPATTVSSCGGSTVSHHASPPTLFSYASSWPCSQQAATARSARRRRRNCLSPPLQLPDTYAATASSSCQSSSVNLKSRQELPCPYLHAVANLNFSTHPLQSLSLTDQLPVPLFIVTQCRQCLLQ